MKKFKVLLTLLAIAVLIYACHKKEEPKPERISFKIPANFPAAIYKFENNTLTNDGFTLGKKLFYDARLSTDKSVSCGSCHQQFAAFAQLDHPVSHGVNNCLGKRNAPVLFNLAWQREYFWDGGAKNLETIPINAITDECEMATDLNEIVHFLTITAPYPQLFKAAFGSDNINSQTFLKALAQFTATMVSANSKYDKVMLNPQANAFTDDELKGYQLFKDKCNNCHTEPLFTNLSYASNGLDMNSDDQGRKRITGLASDADKFRIPTLRNIALSAPYMHDGRFATLTQVVEHYNSGVKNASNLAAELNKNGRFGIALNTTEKQQLISFLKTLTDDEFIKNPLFSED